MSGGGEMEEGKTTLQDGLLAAEEEGRRGPAAPRRRCRYFIRTRAIRYSAWFGFVALITSLAGTLFERFGMDNPDNKDDYDPSHAFPAYVGGSVLGLLSSLIVIMYYTRNKVLRTHTNTRKFRKYMLIRFVHKLRHNRDLVSRSASALLANSLRCRPCDRVLVVLFPLFPLGTAPLDRNIGRLGLGHAPNPRRAISILHLRK